MSTFQHTLWFMGHSFHTWTFAILVFQFLIILYLTRECGIYSLVISTVSATLTIHFYETIHAFFSWSAVGCVGAALWKFNIPVVIGLSIMLYFYNKKYKFLNRNPIYILTMLSLTFSCMIWLYYTGFFLSLDYGFVWAMSKASVSCAVIFLFIGGESEADL